MIINTFQGEMTSKYAAFDTETHTYIDGNIVPEDEIRRMMLETKTDEKGKTVPRYPLAWWRKHTHVEAWAYIVYTPEGFAILETFDEFCKFCAQYRIRHGWWYYAPFDYAVLDWQSLTHGWTYAEKPKNPNEFGDLSNDFGARYTMTQIFPYNPAYSFHARAKRQASKLQTYDFRNLLRGGLDYLLKKFDVTDADGTPIRKLEMDYQSAGTDGTNAADLEYMLNDARGLWWLIQKFGTRLREKYAIDILSGKPQVMTASGLAKVLMLRKLYPNARNDHGTKKLFRKYHPMTLELDAYFRRTRLLQGGLVIVNPYARGQYLHDVDLFRYDYNSHYPARMREMPDIVGYPLALDGEAEKRKPEQVRIFEIDELSATLRLGFLPAWLNPISRKVDSEVTIYKWRDPPCCIFDFELEELRKWYNIGTCHISRTWLYNTRQVDGYREFVDEHYKDKQEAAAAHDEIGKMIPKLTLNGASGKFSQNPNHVKTSRELTEENTVTLARGEADADEESLMNIVQGAYITAMGRVILRQSCRDIADRARKPVAACILYTDTDSIHSTEQYDGCDPLQIGKLKCENKKPITQAIFLAPKTYAEIIGDIKPEDVPQAVKDELISLHCKGVHVESLQEALQSGESLPKVYKVGRKYLSLSAVNVQGGKALLPLPKCVCKSLPDDLPESELYF